ncbi:MAG: protein kinase [Alphaproteobacteria bacterium]|nr:protein kinase [Alphaproteobacteria bacterium]
MCSFCHKPQWEAERMIAGRGVNICSDCVGLIRVILHEQELPEAVVPELVERTHALATGAAADAVAVRERIDELGDILMRRSFYSIWGLLSFPERGGREAAQVRLLRVLGAGAGATVWEGERARGPVRRVAVKVFEITRVTTGLHLWRFLRGLRAMERLSDPPLPGVMEVLWVSQDRLSFVMPLLHGDLRRFEGPEAEALRVFRGVCEAVHAAHLRGVIHGDLKPANVLLDAEGDPFVGDFAFADVRASARRSVCEDDLGTARFCAPERLQGQEATVAADVYSLGKILCWMLTKEPPPFGPNVLDGALGAVVTRATAEELQGRYPSVAALMAAMG